VAPANAAYEEGGIGTQRSSQISAKKVKRGSSPAWKSNRSPKGMSSCPYSEIAIRVAEEAGANCRNS
jgi:hypothetical protein